MFTDYETAGIKIAWEFSFLIQNCKLIVGRQENMIKELKGHWINNPKMWHKNVFEFKIREHKCIKTKKCNVITKGKVNFAVVSAPKGHLLLYWDMQNWPCYW